MGSSFAIMMLLALWCSACHPLITTTKPLINTPRTVSHLFKDLVVDHEDDLRADIVSIQKKEGLESFLDKDERLCIIKVYAPFCKACKAFGRSFLKLALEEGDGLNSLRQVQREGQARFGQLEYSANAKLCKELKVKRMPLVLIYRGRQTGLDPVSTIECKGHGAVEVIKKEMEQITARENA
mmetsp:Transcript_27401/g.65138  ORF Transcript_27401/g.65138 Transcript_27401/m.65138 type:complete len:182 (-) Transcript_27401:910-1455(-)